MERSTGFYVYRNDRLIVNGGWLNLKKMKADEHTKLARIIVDFDPLRCAVERRCLKEQSKLA